MAMTFNKHGAGASIASAILVLGVLGGCSKPQDEASLLAQAKQYSQKGDSKAAMIELKNVLVKNANNVEARLALGKVHIDMVQGAAAEKELRKALELGASRELAVPLLAKALLLQQQYKKVLEDTAAGPMSAELQAARGDAEAALGNADKARQAYDLALAARPGFPAALIGMARLAVTEKQFEAADKMAAQALALHPKDTDVLMLKGDLLRGEGKADEAKAAYAEVLKIDPAHRNAWVNQAYLDISRQDFTAAKADLDAARKAAPDNLNVLHAQGLLEFSQGQHAQAKDTVLKILKVAPEHLPTLLLAGSVEFALRSLPQAEQHLKKYLEAFPDHAYARKQLGAVYLQQGRPAQALETLTSLTGPASQDVQALALAGDANVQLRNYAEAGTLFERASAIDPKAPVLRNSLAMSKMAQGDDARAIRELEESAKLDTTSVRSGMLLAVTELRLKHYDKALAAVNALEASQPPSAEVQTLKGGIYVAMKDLPKARASFEKALALNPAYFTASANLAQMAITENKPDVAKALMLKVLEKDGKNTEAMQALAELARKAGREGEVTEWLEKSNAANPNAAAQAVMLGAHYLTIGQADKALLHLRKYHAQMPQNADLLDLLGRAQLALGDKPGALESFSKLVGLAPKSAMAHYRLAQIHVQLNNPGAAAEDLKRAMTLQPEFLDAQVALVEIALRNGQPAQALQLARQMQAQKPKLAVGYALEGNLHWQMKKPELAVAPYEKAFALGRTTPNLIKWHSAMTAAGRGKEADARLADWQKTHASDGYIDLYLGELSLSRKQYKEAISRFESVLKQTPRNAQAMNNLAWAYQQEKDPRAVATAQQAVALVPDNAGYLDTLGWALVEQGKVAEGLPHLQKAVQLAPDASEFRFHLGSAMAKNGDKVGARTELAKVVAARNAPEMDEAKALLNQL